jgi:transposase-like protein
MADAPAPPVCPVCRAEVVSLIATVKDETTLDIFLCHACHAQFSAQRAEETSKPRPIAPT